ncbi:MAG: TA system VapC family ribonuclease toxin [Oceanipulchritudo sp.]
MSYSIDANVLLFAVNSEAPEHPAALAFLKARKDDPDLLCLTWPALMAFQRIATHPFIFHNPLTPNQAWGNITALLNLPRARVITEGPDFPEIYAALSEDLKIRGNLVPDAHIAAILRQHGVRRIYTADSDFKKFDFLEVCNPL